MKSKLPAPCNVLALVLVREIAFAKVRLPPPLSRVPALKDIVPVPNELLLPITRATLGGVVACQRGHMLHNSR